MRVCVCVRACVRACVCVTVKSFIDISVAARVPVCETVSRKREREHSYIYSDLYNHSNFFKKSISFRNV